MPNKPTISYRTEPNKQNGLKGLDIVASAICLVVTFLFIASAISAVIKPFCLLIGVEFSWIIPAVIAVVIIIVLCTI